MMSNAYQCNSVPGAAECKICGGLARIAGVTDFSRCGADVLAGKKVEPYEGTPVYYYQCSACRFAFTCVFDHWTHDDFVRHVYNADYARHDPAYLEARPRENAALISDNFGASRADGSILDYGSGLGLLENRLREQGFRAVDSFDPFTAPARPTRRYEMVTCFEVFEHSPQPAVLMADLKSLLAPNGAILFSTQLCTAAVIGQGICNWWYCSPRNGHVSFYSVESLTELGRQQGLQFSSFNEAQHVFFQDDLPVWLKPYISRAPAQ